jgi:hypothetical protein
VYVEPPLHPWDEANLVMLGDLSDVFWIQFATILLRTFASMFIKEIKPIVLLFGGVFVWFGDESNIGFIK